MDNYLENMTIRHMILSAPPMLYSFMCVFLLLNVFIAVYFVPLDRSHTCFFVLNFKGLYNLFWPIFGMTHYEHSESRRLTSLHDLSISDFSRNSVAFDKQGSLNYLQSQQL